MPSRSHHTHYDAAATDRCERALITLLGDLGPWSERLYLVGGLAPRYLVGEVPTDAAPHVGTMDVDLVIGISIAADEPEAYRTLHNNLRRSGFAQSKPSFAWTRVVDGAPVKIEFMCETDAVEPGNVFRPRSGTGTDMAAFNVPGAMLVTDDFIEVELEGERLDDGGRSRVTLRVADNLSYVVLKILAFQDRHENKDAYDLVFTLLHAEGGPATAGSRAAESRVADSPQVEDAIGLLAERFAAPDMDGPSAYAAFLTADDDEETARYRQQAVATVRAFLDGLRSSGHSAETGS